MADFPSLIEELKAYRRSFAERLAHDDDPDLAKKLGEIHTAILAVEAVMAEPEPVKTGPKIEFGKDGWPKG